jgi:hypothetical protein
MRPDLVAVLAMVVPGRSARLCLTADQKRAFRDRDGRIALAVVRHLVAARRSAGFLSRGAADTFPLTDAGIQRVAGRLGDQVGIKRCREMRRRLIAAGIIEAVGSYRRAYSLRVPSGFRVLLYRLAVAATATGRRVRGAPHLPASVGRGGLVKRPRWWEHPLFGTPDGLPPPGISRRVARRMRSRDEVEQSWC